MRWLLFLMAVLGGCESQQRAVLPPPEVASLTSLPCNNGSRDLGESDVDCGGGCGPCPDYRGCFSDADCQSGFCLPSSLCASGSPRLIGGQVIGLLGEGLVIEEKVSGAQLLPAGAGGFFFSELVAAGTTYDIVVVAQPSAPKQECTVENGSGRVLTDNIVTALVTCVTVRHTLGGTAIGVPPEGVVLKNGRTLLTVSASGAFTFPTPLPDGSEYAVSLAGQPATAHCILRNGEGFLEAPANDLSIVCLGAVSVPYGNGNWNTYVRRTAPSEPCGADDVGTYLSCIHTGEKRTVALPFLSSCQGVTAKDALDAFEWWCDDRTQPVTVRSTLLKNERSLYELLKTTAPRGFKPNHVEIETPLGSLQTTSTVWWSNPVVLDADGGAFTTPGVVYLVSNDVAQLSWSFNASNVTLALAPDVSLRFDQNSAGAQWYMVSQPSADFIWIDGGRITGEDYAMPVNLQGKRNVVRNTLVEWDGAGPSLVYVVATGARSMIRNARITGHYRTGTHCVFMPYSAFVWDSVLHGCQYGTQQPAQGFNALYVGTTFAGNQIGAAGNQGNVWINTGAIANADGGLQLVYATTLLGATIANNAGPSSALTAMGLDAAPTRIEDVLFVNNGALGGFFANPASALEFNSVRVLNSGGLDAGSGSELYTANNCTYTGCGIMTYDPARVGTGLYFMSPTYSGSAGTQLHPFFDAGGNLLTPLQVWTHDTASFPYVTQGRCTSGTCRVWDFNLAPDASPYRDVRPTPAPAQLRPHGFHALSNQAECDRAYPGSTYSGRCIVQRYQHAWEVLGDDVGNEDGLCSPGERCRWMRHVGADQGADAPVF